jgi:hypothetical protein
MYVSITRAHSCLYADCLVGGAVPAEGPPLRIFTWREDTAAHLLGAAPMTSVGVSYAGHNRPLGVAPDSARPARDAAREAAILLRRQDPTLRAILLFGIGQASGPRGEPPLYPNNDRNIEAYAREGLIDFTRQWATEFWQTLADMRVTPAFIVLDYEGGAGFWSLKRDFKRDFSSPAAAPDWAVGSIIALQRLQEAIGTLPGGYAPIDFVSEDQHWGHNHRAITSFNEWADSRRAGALRTSIIRPAWDTFHDEIPASNFREQLRAWPGMDLNDWSIAPGPISGNWSSPQAYLGITGQHYSVHYKSQTLEFRRALSWLDRRNDIRAALALTRNVAPWYSNPDYARDPDQGLNTQRVQWAAGLLHDRAVGVSVMLFWSDRPWTADEVAFAQPILAYLRTMPVKRPAAIGKLDESHPENDLAEWVQLAAKLSPQ